MVKILGDITEVGTISGSVGTFSASLTISGIPVNINNNHADLEGLIDDDHPQYIKTDGTRVFTGDQSFGGNDVSSVGILTAAKGVFVSNSANTLTVSGNAQTVLRVRGGGILLDNNQLFLGSNTGGTAVHLISRSLANTTTVGDPASQEALLLAGGWTDGIQFYTGGDLWATLDTSGKFSSITISGEAGQFGGALSARTGAFSNYLTVSGVSVMHTGITGITVSGSAVNKGQINFVGSRAGNISISGNTITFDAPPDTTGAGGGGINNVVEDTTPQLGGNLDAQTFDITGVGTLEATTVTGTTGQFGGTVSADTGSFKNLTDLIEPFDFGWTAAATGTLVLEQQALYPYTINQLTGQTGQGTVSGTLKVNNVIVGGVNNQTWNTTASTKIATSNNSVVIGDRVSFVVSGTSNGKFVGFTLKTTRV